jgi:NADPH-dependent 2,4-dienoyl-CoA reductase/sulfur reductase-like enzyme
MTTADIVVVGGSAAGVTAAITARRHYPDRKVLLVRREDPVSVPCGIPYVFGTLGTPDENLIPDSILDKHDIELLVTEVQEIDRTAHLLATDSGPVGYERLILATGSVPIMPPIPGSDLNGVFAITKDVDQLRALQQALVGATNVAVIGGGFIGIEFADEINKSDRHKVTVLELAPHCLNLAYDPEFCTEMEDHLTTRGVTVRTSTMVTRIAGEQQVSAIEIDGGAEIPADLVILGIGARANVALAKAAGLPIGAEGGIVVDRMMRSADPAIFACGDCAEKTSFFGGRPSSLKLASIAQHEARVAGANVFELQRQTDGTVGVWSTAVGPLAMGTAGLTESMAQQHGYHVVAATVETPNRHPAGMPGVCPMRVKLVFEAHSQVLLGGQVRNGNSVGEMINTIAACVQKRMTAEDIAMFQMGTHPALTASPIAYPLVNAAEQAIQQCRPAELNGEPVATAPGAAGAPEHACR